MRTAGNHSERLTDIDMRYEFTDHPSRQGWFRVTDTKWMMVCEFQAHRFNDTQNYIDMGQLPADPNKVAHAMSELGDWLYKHHYSDVFPAPTYETRLSEDDSELHIIRHKEPVMDAVFKTDDMVAIADALAKAAEYVRKCRRGK